MRDSAEGIAGLVQLQALLRLGTQFALLHVHCTLT